MHHKILKEIEQLRRPANTRAVISRLNFNAFPKNNLILTISWLKNMSYVTKIVHHFFCIWKKFQRCEFLAYNSYYVACKEAPCRGGRAQVTERLFDRSHFLKLSYFYNILIHWIKHGLRFLERCRHPSDRWCASRSCRPALVDWSIN